MFLDASAIVAIIGQEAAGSSLLRRISLAELPVYYSSTVVFEAVIALARKKKISIYGEHSTTPASLIEETQDLVRAFLEQVDAVEVNLPVGLHQEALGAAKTFGRFVGHPARLNFGDCFSYAAAKSLKVPLLFVGDDFARTDIEIA
ncbi:MAG: type II toxin-antitoxin system VapC family toxin [Pseudorhizobium pelagicum]|uniref:type II toxin-antitoxin system VapC family toxin n=1 Tax=Pseudorhizobium pelagicum TaxID=1509405 RepID=UPI00345FBF92